MPIVIRNLVSVGIALACALWVLFSAVTGSHLLQDTDTQAILAAVRARHNPLSWFGGDWPLRNHFYRPIPTLTFELDNSLWGDSATGYGWTNAALAALCVLALFWLAAELLRSPPKAAAATLLFTCWLLGPPVSLTTALLVLAIAISVLGVLNRRALGWPVAAGLAIAGLAQELIGIAPLHYRTIGWLPGRTATVMTLFALISLAAFARYLFAHPATAAHSPSGPLDPPATRTTTLTKPGRPAPIWLVITLIACTIALASYEQAVTLPFLLAALWTHARIIGRALPLWPLAFLAVILVGYMILRSTLIPTSMSAYQMQQTRTGPGVWISLQAYVLPALGGIQPLFSLDEAGASVFFVPAFYEALLTILGGVALYGCAVRSKAATLAILTWAQSVFAFAPMAWLKPFEHYHFLPMAIRSVFVVLCAVAVGEAITAATSRRSRQAPPRPDPAPGSLARP